MKYLIWLLLTLMATAAWGMAGQPPQQPAPSLATYSFHEQDKTFDFQSLKTFSVSVQGPAESHDQVQAAVIAAMQRRGYALTEKGLGNLVITVAVSSEIRNTQTYISEKAYAMTQQLVVDNQDILHRDYAPLSSKPLVRKNDQTGEVEIVMVQGYAIINKGASQIWQSGAYDATPNRSDLGYLVELALAQFPNR
jgi:hypothetical protein